MYKNIVIEKQISSLNPEIAQISISPNVQDKVVEHILLQSGGVGLGLILALIGSVFIFKWLGIPEFIKRWMDKLDSEAESLRSLANAVNSLAEDSKDNHNKYVTDHQHILSAVSEVKEEVRDIKRKLE
ncbi:MAG: hypothetical protein HEQ20_03915 [Aphanizomenon flos-aquae KM1D3_PB]|nr:MAG: hypothetical protein HEQ20_03915 [Aphanizomenon flos-aquae KM1D3_PB]